MDWITSPDRMKLSNPLLAIVDWIATLLDVSEIWFKLHHQIQSPLFVNVSGMTG